MPLEKLVERIISDGRKQAERIVSEAQLRRIETISDANAAAEERYARQVDAARRAAGEEKRQRVTVAAVESRKSILEEKQALIAETFKRALKVLVELPREEYMELMVKMLATEMGERNSELVLSPGDRERLGKEIVSAANDALSEGGKLGRLTLSEDTRDIAGGFILHMDGIEINNSLEAQINSQRLELEPRVVEILFGPPELSIKI
jgi:V/A-type H+-transporting ATPase subunit E